jgi:hypothetical protein
METITFANIKKFSFYFPVKYEYQFINNNHKKRKLTNKSNKNKKSGI